MVTFLTPTMLLPSIFKIRSTIRNGIPVRQHLHHLLDVHRAAFGGGRRFRRAVLAGGGANVCAARNGLVDLRDDLPDQFAIRRRGSGRTAIKWPRIGRPSSDRSPTMSSILCRTNSSGYRSGSVVSTASSRMTTAFSRLPPLMRPFLMRYSISSKKQNVRACASSFSQVLGVISVLNKTG